MISSINIERNAHRERYSRRRPGHPCCVQQRAPLVTSRAISAPMLCTCTQQASISAVWRWKRRAVRCCPARRGVGIGASSCARALCASFCIMAWPFCWADNRPHSRGTRGCRRRRSAVAYTGASTSIVLARRCWAAYSRLVGEGFATLLTRACFSGGDIVKSSWRWEICCGIILHCSAYVFYYCGNF